jgi:hypothetical protein
MTKPLPFSESRVRRAISAVRKEGLAVRAVMLGDDPAVLVDYDAIRIGMNFDRSSDRNRDH